MTADRADELGIVLDRIATLAELMKTAMLEALMHDDGKRRLGELHGLFHYLVKDARDAENMLTSGEVQP